MMFERRQRGIGIGRYEFVGFIRGRRYGRRMFEANGGSGRWMYDDTHAKYYSVLSLSYYLEVQCVA